MVSCAGPAPATRSWPDSSAPSAPSSATCPAALRRTARPALPRCSPCSTARRDAHEPARRAAGHRHVGDQPARRHTRPTRGWIVRTPDPLDRRSRLLRLSPSGDADARRAVRAVRTACWPGPSQDWSDEDLGQPQHPAGAAARELRRLRAAWTARPVPRPAPPTRPRTVARNPRTPQLRRSSLTARQRVQSPYTPTKRMIRRDKEQHGNEHTPGVRGGAARTRRARAHR